VRTVTVEVDPGSDGGQLTNCAELTGADLVDTVNGPIDPLNGLPTVPFNFTCAAGVDLQACASVTFEGQSPPPLDSCSYTKGGYAGPGVPGQIFNANFSSVSSGGLTIGIADGAGPKHDALWTAASPGLATLKTYLTSPAGGASGALTGDTTNATSTSGAQLARQTATLTLNVAFSAAGKLGGSPLGDLCVVSINKTVSQVLADADQALGRNGLPSYVGSFGNLNTLITNLNESFDNCTISTWATENLAASCQ
jgi:hypothetical protein